jgi:hypothetical protein
VIRRRRLLDLALLALIVLLVGSAPALAARRSKKAVREAAPATAPGMDADAARKVVEEAKARAVAIPAQVQALLALAFPASPVDPAVQEAARSELVVFADRGISDMAAAIPRVPVEQRAPLVQTMMLAFRQLTFGLPSDYLPGLESAIWFGDHATRALAIPEFARFRQRGASLTLADAANEDPSLVPLVARAMGQIGDARARFWLAEVMRGTDPVHRSEAAVALAQIGGPALALLKDGMRSDDRAIRETACRALLPVAGLEDITALHEYVARRPDDDPALLEAVRNAALLLEEALAARDANESASPPQ